MAVIAPEPVPALSRRLEVGEPSARSLLLTVLGEYVLPRGEPVWTAAIVRTLALLGVAEKTARQALARTAAEGWIASSRHGRLARWQLTGAGLRLLTDGAQRIYSFGRDAAAWDGRWLVLLVGVPEARRELRHRLRTMLAWSGFGALPGGVWVCPDPRREAEAGRILASLGLTATSMSFVAHHGVIGAQADIVSRAWDLGAVEDRYREFIESFAALTPATGAETLIAQTMLVHEWRRFPFLDPQLPRDLLPAGWLGADAAELFRARHARWHDDATRCWTRLAAGGPPAVR